MTTGSIIKFDNALSAVISCIPIHEGDWDTVSLSDIERINEFLEDSYVHFQELISEDRREKGLNFQHVINICRTLKKYSTWFFLCKSVFQAAKETQDNSVRKKAELAEVVYIHIEVLWIAYLRQIYPETKEFLLPKLSILETIEHRKERKDEELRREETDQVYSYFNGNTREIELRFNLLQKVINGKGGKDVALYEAAAIKLKWITEPIKWPYLKKYFGVIGNHQNISNYLNTSVNKLRDSDVKRCENELLRLSRS